jgi:hypothetical protein
MSASLGRLFAGICVLTLCVATRATASVKAEFTSGVSTQRVRHLPIVPAVGDRREADLHNGQYAIESVADELEATHGGKRLAAIESRCGCESFSLSVSALFLFPVPSLESYASSHAGSRSPPPR